MERPVIIIFSSWYKPFIGGSEVAISEITARLSHKYEFHVVTYRARRDLPKEEDNEGILIHRDGFGTLLDIRILFPFLAWYRAARILRASRGRPVILWGVMVSYATIGAFFLKLFHPRIPFLFTIQEGNEEWRFRLRNLGLSALWWRLMFRQVDYATAISQYLKDQLRTIFYRGPISIIPNGVDERLLDIVPKKISGISVDEKIIFSASRLVYKNGIDLLLRACAQIRDQFNFHVVLAGDGEDRAVLEKLAQELGLADQITFLGMVPYETLASYYAKADLFVRPSRTEGLGNAFLEAMAAGVLTVGTPVGGIRDFLKDGETGFLANPEDADNLMHVIRKILKLSNEEKNDIIKNARTEIKRRYLWKNIAIQMDKIFLNELELNP